MLKVLKLALAFLGEHRLRIFLTSLATIAAGVLVIWIASGYDALLKTYDEYADLALGRYALAIAPIDREGEHNVPSEVIEALRADPATSVVDPMWAFHAEVRPRKPGLNAEPELTDRPPRDGPTPAELGFEGGPGSGPNARSPESLLLATSAPQPPFDLAKGQWINAIGEPGIVARADAADRLGVEVGDVLIIESRKHSIELPLVGIVEAPTLEGAGAAALPILSPSSGEFFVSEATATELLQSPARISLIGISLKPDADLTKFRFGWAPRLSQFSTPVQFQQAYEIEEALDQAAAASNVKLQSYAATGVGMLIALLTILSTLNIGVNERVRQYAILRTISFTRFQIGLLIAFEGLLLGGIGFVGSLAAGWGLLNIVASSSAKILYHGAELGTNSIVLAAVATIGGAFLASLIPGWRAMRIQPIEAMAPASRPMRDQPTSLAVLAVAIGLISVNPLLTFVFPPRFEAGVYARMLVGFLSMAIGFLLLAPAAVWIVDRVCGPWVARLFAIDRKLLASQLTGHMWRTVGTATSLAVGLALVISIQVWGHTMLEAFVPGRWAPDALLSFRPDGLSFEKAAEVASIPGIDPRRCQPIVVEQPRLLKDLTDSAERASVIRQDNIVIVGIDPEGAFGGDAPLLKLEWVAESPSEAVAQMRQGRACVVPNHFLIETGLEVGDSFSLVAPENPSHTPRYRIAGAVQLPGWHWQTKLTGFRTRTHRTAALIFTDIASVSADFDLPRASHVWFSYASADANPNEIAAAAQKRYADTLGRPVKIGAAGEGEPTVHMMPVRGIRDILRNMARRWLWVVSQIPLVAMLIAGLGLLNVMLASVRSRSWEFGVLRAIGITGPAMVRAVLAEGLLIGMVAAILGVGFGTLAGWCGCGIAQYISFFGGLHPDLVMPWGPIGAGIAAVLLLSVTASAWPAISIGRARPLRLLQHSRPNF